MTTAVFRSAERGWWCRRGLIAATAAVFVVAIGLQFTGFDEYRPASTLPDFEDLWPSTPPGWTVQNLPLGLTESLTTESLNVLRLD